MIHTVAVVVWCVVPALVRGEVRGVVLETAVVADAVAFGAVAAIRSTTTATPEHLRIIHCCIWERNVFLWASRDFIWWHACSLSKRLLTLLLKRPGYGVPRYIWDEVLVFDCKIYLKHVRMDSFKSNAKQSLSTTLCSPMVNWNLEFMNLFRIGNVFLYRTVAGETAAHCYCS